MDPMGYQKWHRFVLLQWNECNEYSCVNIHDLLAKHSISSSYRKFIPCFKRAEGGKPKFCCLATVSQKEPSWVEKLLTAAFIPCIVHVNVELAQACQEVSPPERWGRIHGSSWICSWRYKWRGFLKNKYPQIIHFKRIFHYKLPNGYGYPPSINIYIYNII